MNKYRRKQQALKKVKIIKKRRKKKMEERKQKNKQTNKKPKTPQNCKSSTQRQRFITLKIMAEYTHIHIHP